MPDLPFTLQQLQVFTAVAGTGSITQAARSLHLTQPAASLAVKELERRLSVDLFERVRNRLLLTPEGEVFRARALDILEIAAEAAEEMAHGELGGTLRIGASTTIGNYILPELLGEFLGGHPSARVELSVDNSLRIIEGVLSQNTPTAFIEGPCAHPDLRMERFLADELVVLCPPDHPWARLQSISIDQLAGERFILREPGSGTRDVIIQALESVDVRLRTDLELGHTEAIKTAVGAGLGATILSRVACEREIRAGVLAEVRVEGLRIDRWFHRIRLAARRESPLMRAFIDFATERVNRTGAAGGTELTRGGD